MSLCNSSPVWKCQCFPSAMGTLESDQRFDLLLLLAVSYRISNTKSDSELARYHKQIRTYSLPDAIDE